MAKRMTIGSNGEFCRGCQIVGGDKQPRDVRWLDDHRPAVRTGPDEVKRVGHETAWFRPLAIETELADDQLMTTARGGREVTGRITPKIKASLIEIWSGDGFDKPPQVLKHPFFAVVAATQRALMSKPVCDPLVQSRRRRGVLTHDCLRGWG
jgi:hypothetical protein